MKYARSELSLPPLVSKFVAPLPRFPAETLLSLLVRHLVARRPDLLRRLGAVVQVPIAIIPDDLPHAFLLSLKEGDSRVSICAKEDVGTAQAIVRAPLLVLLGLMDGTFDGDAMFFSRDLRIEGKTEYVLALRNTLEEADLTPGEFLGLTEPSSRWVNTISAKLLEQARSFAAKTTGRQNTVSEQNL